MQLRYILQVNYTKSRVIELHKQFFYLHKFIVRAQFLLLFLVELFHDSRR